jgi:hypothetical protein
MTDKQRRSVRALAKQAGITPTTTKVAPNHPFLNELAPGDRVFVETSSIDMHPAPERKPGGPRKGGPKRQFTAGHKPSGPKSHGDRSHNDRSQNNAGRPSAGKQRNKYRGNRKAR